MRPFVCFMVSAVVLSCQLCGCYSIKKWDVKEGREKVYLDDPSKEKLDPTRSPVRGAINVALVTPKHLACIMRDETDSEEDVGGEQQVCRMQSIPGVDATKEWMTLYRETEGKKTKVGFIAMNMGDVLRTELEASLRQYYASVDVKLIDAPSEKDKKQMAKKMAFYVKSGDGAGVLNDTSGTVRAEKKARNERAGVDLTFYIDNVPVSVWVPIETERDRIDSQEVADALRISTSDLARKIMAYEDNAINAAERDAESDTISVLF